MYLRRINRKKSGKSHYYWALVESYRTEKGVRQRIVGYIGDVSKKQAQKLHESVEPCYSYQQDFLSPEELPEKAQINPKKTRWPDRFSCVLFLRHRPPLFRAGPIETQRRPTR